MAKLIVRQQDMSVEILAQLRADGVNYDSTLLRLDFEYNAPGRAEAEDLAQFPSTSADYEIGVSLGPRWGLRRDWQVTGKTQPTPVSRQILDDWIRWMVLAGAGHGECRFDGWGALVET